MGDDVKAKEERFRLRVRDEALSARAVVGDANPGTLTLSLAGAVLAQAPEVTETYLGRGGELRGKVLSLDGLVKKEHPGSASTSIWLWVTMGADPPKRYSVALDAEDGANVSLGLHLRFL